MAKEEVKTHKYGVQQLAEALGIGEASARVRLRDKGIAKAGKSYGWTTRAELDEVVAKLKGESSAKVKPAAKTEKAKPVAKAEKAKPAVKAAVKKVAKKAA